MTEKFSLTKEVPEERETSVPETKPNRFRWLAPLVAAVSAALSGGAPTEAKANMRDKVEKAQAALQKAAEGRVFDFDDDAATEKARAVAEAKHYADLLAHNKKPELSPQAVAGMISIDHRKGVGSVIRKVEGKDPREQEMRGQFKDLLGKPVIFKQRLITSETGEADVTGYERDGVTIYEFMAVEADTAKAVPLSLEVNVGTTDPREDVASSRIYMQKLGDSLNDFVIERSSNAEAAASPGKIAALEQKTKSAVIEGTKTTLRQQVTLEQFQTQQPMGFSVEKRGENFWIIGVRYEMTPKTTVATAEK